MRLLLDSHVLIWSIYQPDRLGRNLEDLITDVRNDRLASVASIWELALKAAKGRISLPQDLRRVLADASIDVLPVGLDHALAAATLPDLHGDPFDRMLVAQAQVEQLTLVTADRRMADYDIDVLTP